MTVVVRPADRPGDLGWMVWQNGEVYAATLGWDTSYRRAGGAHRGRLRRGRPRPTRLAGSPSWTAAGSAACCACRRRTHRHRRPPRPARHPGRPRTRRWRRLSSPACLDHARGGRMQGGDALDERRPHLGPADLRGRGLPAGRLRGAPLVRRRTGGPELAAGARRMGARSGDGRPHEQVVVADPTRGVLGAEELRQVVGECRLPLRRLGQVGQGRDHGREARSGRGRRARRALRRSRPARRRAPSRGRRPAHRRGPRRAPGRSSRSAQVRAVVTARRGPAPRRTGRRRRRESSSPSRWCPRAGTP